MTPFTLNVTFHAAKDRLLDALTVDVRGAAGVATAVESLGLRRASVTFVNSGERIEVSIKIPGILDIVQELTVVEVHDPRGTHVGVDPTGLKLHRRLTLQPTISSGAAQINLALDVTFLNVSNSPAHHSNFTTAGYPPGVKAYAFERMTGKPRTWVVVVPDNMRQDDPNIQALLFLRPESPDPYINSDKCEFKNINWYLQGTVGSPKCLSLPRIGTLPLYSRFPGWGAFAHQLVRSGKRVVLMAPLPHGNVGGTQADFGDLIPSSGAPGIKVVRELLMALYQERLICQDGDFRPFLMRFAASGFSLGGKLVQDFWATNKDEVDELYLFDPGNGLRSAELETWFKTAPHQPKYLRVMATAYSLAHAAQLIPKLASSRASMMPPNRDYFFDEVSTLAQPYRDAHSDALLDPVGTATRDSTSDKSGVFVVGATTRDLRLRGWGSDGGPPVEQSVGAGSGSEPMAVREAAMFVEHFIRQRPPPPRAPAKPTAHELREILPKLIRNTMGVEQPLVWSHRHAWAVVGGEVVGGTFKRYLELCLERSAFF